MIRAFSRAPGFALSALLLVTIAVLANATAFSALYTVLWKPLPYAHGEQMVELRMDLRDIGIQVGLSGALYRLLREDTATFSGAVGSIALTSHRKPGEGRDWHVQRITADFTDVLGAQPALGRAFLDSDESSGPAPILLSDRAWRTHFAANPDVLGKQQRLGDQDYTIVGVMPRGFGYPDAEVDAWVPYVATAAEREQDAAGGFGLFTVAARLTPQASLTQAQASLSALLANTELLAGLRGSGAKFAGDARSWRARFASGHAQALSILQLAALLLLVVIAANLSGLVISRYSARHREFAVYNAIGADASDLCLGVCLELLPIAGLGMLLGLALTPACLDLLGSRGLLSQTLAVPVTVDWSVLLVIIATTLIIATAMVLAAMSTLRGGQRTGSGLRERATSTSGGGRVRFMVAQVALCTALAGSAGLLARSAWLLVHEARGFDADGVVLSAVDMSTMNEAGHDEASVAAAYARLRAEIVALPGVTAVAVADSTPFGSSHFIARVQVPDGEREVRSYVVSPGYFKAMGIPLSVGRDFSREDAGNFRAVVIDEAFERTWFVDSNPIGQFVRVAAESNSGFIDAPIVAVVPKVKHNALDETDAMPALYSLMPETPAFFTLVTRTESDPTALTNAVRVALDRHAPDATLSLNAPLQQLVAKTLANRLALLELVGLFAVVALLLAAFGLYATLSLEVGRRTAEFGVRMALGASSARVRGLVMARGGRVIAIGAVLGVGIGVPLTSVMSNQLYQVRTGDPTIWILTSAIVIGIAGCACWLPARRATRIQPLAALQVQ